MNMQDGNAERVARLLQRIATAKNGRLLIEDMADVEHDTLYLLVQGDLATCHPNTVGGNYATLTMRGFELAAQVAESLQGPQKSCVRKVPGTGTRTDPRSVRRIALDVPQSRKAAQ